MPKPGAYLERVKKFTKDAAEQRRLETARLNKKYKDSPPASFKIMPKPGAYSERCEGIHEGCS
jgi:hypothetical protein